MQRPKSEKPVRRTKPIPVGRLVSVTPKRRVPAAKPAPPPRASVDWKTVGVAGGVAWLAVSALVGVLFVSDRRSPRPESTPTAEEQTANPSTFVPGPPATVAGKPSGRVMRPSPPTPAKSVAVAPEVLPLPRPLPTSEAVVPEDPVATIAFPVVVNTAGQKAANGPDAVEGQRDEVVAAEPDPLPEGTATFADPATCGRFGTKVNFLDSPTLAYGKSKADAEKLVLILQVAGNFEESGFT
jgi:hypothetical protein